jgi:thymidylate synthase (FAD)
LTPYAELLEFNQPNPIRKPGFTRIRDQFEGLRSTRDHVIYDKDEVVLTVPFPDPERIVEFAGRWDYGENNARRLGETTRLKVDVKRRLEDTGEVVEESSNYVEVPIIHKYIDMGHESMLEMADATFFIECSRVVSHELVRHRIASFQQESQRFVKYDDVRADDLFYMPPEIADTEENVFRDENGIYSQDEPTEEWMFGIPAQDAMIGLYDQALETYKALRKVGVPPQIARYVFPNATRTRLVMKTNLREWRHICKLRLDKSAQPEMQELMQQIYDQLVDVFPNVMYNALDGERGVR